MTQVTVSTEVTEDTYIQPLKLRSTTYPVIVTDGKTVLEEPKFEHTEPYPYRFRPDRLRELAELPHIWATVHPADLFMRFYNRYQSEQDFIFHGRAITKEFRPGMNAGTEGAAVRTVGFNRTKQGKGDKGLASRKRRLHYLLDLRGFIDTKHLPPLEDLYSLALEIRDFLDEMGIGPRQNFAGIGAAMLRHPQFYPNPRKRVPGFINEKARLHLPGNHYDLFTERGTVHKAAAYYDQRNAHHHAALLAPMPSSDSLCAWGFDRGHDEGGGPLWITPENPAWNRVLERYGLFMARVRIPGYHEGEERYLPHEMRGGGEQSVPIWSSELPWIEEMGIKLVGIEWTLSGDEIDEGIRAYAEWALEETQKHPRFKSALLSTYGVLAARRSLSRSIHGVGARQVRWDLKTFKANLALSNGEFTSFGPTNVVQRGIIEAYTRMLTLRFVSNVPRDQQLGLYGDAAIVTIDDKERVIPLEGPWREKGRLDNLEFLSATQFTSDQLTRMPGTRAGMKR